MSDSHTPKPTAGAGALLARRYAHALLEQAQEKKKVKTIQAELDALRTAIHGNKAFHKMAAHPRLPRGSMLKIMKGLAEEAKLDPLTGSFLMLVARNRRLGHLPRIIDAFDALLAEARGQHTAHVRAAHALNEAQTAALAKALGKIAGGTVSINFQKEPDLLGGLVIRLGSRLIDASIKGKLTIIERQLKAQQEAA